MQKDEQKTLTNDNMSNNAHYDKNGKITRIDDRDKKNPDEDWDAEKSRTGRNK